MKKRVLLGISFIVFLVSLAFGLCSCTEENDITYSVNLKETEVSLTVGQEYQFDITVEPDIQGEVPYIALSSNESVITVNADNVVTAVGEGSATVSITVTIDGTVYEQECNFTVTYQQFTATFIVEGEQVQVINFTEKTTSLAEPTIPQKQGYTAAWEAYEIGKANLTIHAHYTPIIYNAIFYKNDNTVLATVPYTVLHARIEEPNVPERAGYQGEWNDYELSLNGVEITPQYTPIVYDVTFIANEKVVDTLTYTVEDKTFTPPTVPIVAWYDGAWEEYTLTTGDIEVQAIYTLHQYSATFYYENKVVDVLEFDKNTATLNEPVLTKKEGYNESWEDYALTNTNLQINAIYAPITYYITYENTKDAENKNLKEFTVETKQITLLKLEKEGYIFKCWNIENVATEVWETEAHDITVTAVWELVQYGVTFRDSNFVAVGKPQYYTVENSTVTAPNVPEKEHYQNGRWEEFAYTFEEMIYVDAVYDAIEYKATFMDDSGTRVIPYTVEDTIIMPTPTLRNGYQVKWDKSSITHGNVTVNAVYTPIEYKISFLNEDETLLQEVSFTVETLSITEPEVPSKDWFTGVWEAYDFTPQNKPVKPIYTPKTYTLTFVADSETIKQQTIGIDTVNVEEPDIPAKTGYTATWETFTIQPKDITVNAVYTPIIYTVKFIADGQVIDTKTYTVENTTLTDIATVPEKQGYTGEWGSYALTHGNVEVNAVYTPITYTVKFIVDGQVIDTKTYTVENTTLIDIPTVPEKQGYTGEWENYTLTYENVEVNAIYTPIFVEKYTVTFVADGNEVKVVTYNKDATEIVVPIVPAKENCVGEWESYTLNSASAITVNALYSSANATEGITYTLSENGLYYTVTGYTGSAKQITIASLYRNLPVEEIADKAFYGLQSTASVTAVTVPNSVKRIGDAAFGNMPKLQSITLPFIGASASASKASSSTLFGYVFGSEAYTDSVQVTQNYTQSKSKYYYLPEKLTTVTVTGGTLYYGAFSGCENLTTVTIGDAVAEIEPYVFGDYENLQTINIQGKWTIVDNEGQAVKEINEIANYSTKNKITYLTSSYCGYTWIRQ